MFRRALKAAAVVMALPAAIVLAAQTSRTPPAAASDALPLIREISIHNNSRNGSVSIDVGLTQLVPYRSFQLSSPKRLVVDLKGALRALPDDVYPAQSRLLERVRVGQWRTDPAIVRVVADLKGAPAFSIKRESFGLRIELKPQKSFDAPARRPRAGRSVSAGNNWENRGETVAPRAALESSLAVHQFKDLSASLAAPVLSPRDRLIPVTKTAPGSSGSLNPAAAAEVSGISIRPDTRGEILVDIASTRSVPYRVFQLADPFRLVVDLENAHKASSRDVYPVNSPVLKRVRVDQWRPDDPPVVRVVADLQGYPIFDVHAQEPGVRIELRPRSPLGPLFRNPFEFETQQQNARWDHAAAPLNQAATAAAGTPAAANSFSGLKVIGFVEQKDSPTQAVIAGRENIYFVPNGGIFENTFRVIAITPNAVELQNIETLDTGWLSYTP